VLRVDHQAAGADVRAETAGAAPAAGTSASPAGPPDRPRVARAGPGHPVPTTRGSHWGFLAFFLSYGGFYLATLALTAVGQSSFDPSELPRPGSSLLASFGPNLLLAVAPVALSWWRGRGPRRDYGIVPTARDIKVGLACGGVSLLVALALSVPLTKIYGDDGSSGGPDVFDGTGAGWLLAYTAYLVVGAPLTEELLFRGALWGALQHYQVPRLAILGITSLLFAFLHLEPSKVASLFAQGLAIGTARMITGRIGASTVAHATNNLFPALSIYLIAAAT
jgi:membrane protease YdiL (CAAX protease family)